MTVYDKAHELAKALNQSEVYQKYREAKEQLEQNEAAREMYRDFRRRQFALQRAQFLGQKMNEEELQRLEKLSELIMQNSTVRNMLEQEFRFGQLFADIQKIIADAVEFDFNPFDDDTDNVDTETEEQS